MQKAKTSINYFPLADRVLVREAPTVTKTPGGIIIPESAEKEPKARGTVVAIGAGFKDQDMTVDLGDDVNYSKYAGSEITVDGETFKVIRETDIFGIFPKQNKPEDWATGGANTQAPVDTGVPFDEPLEQKEMTPEQFQANLAKNKRDGINKA